MLKKCWKITAFEIFFCLLLPGDFIFVENQKLYKPHRMEKQSFDKDEVRYWMNLHSK